MIELNLSDLALWLTAIPLLCIGVYTLLVANKSRRARSKSRNAAIHCRACGHLFRIPPREKQPHCPACNRPNDTGRSRRLG